MRTTTFRVSERSKHILAEFSAREGKSMQAIVEQAIEYYRRQRFLEGLADDFASLRARPGDWNEETEERRAWDITMSEGDKL